MRYTRKTVDFIAIKNETILIKRGDKLIGVSASDLFAEHEARIIALENQNGGSSVDAKKEVEQLIEGKTAGQIFRMFNKTTSTKNGYSMIKIAEILGINPIGTKRKLAARIADYKPKIL